MDKEEYMSLRRQLEVLKSLLPRYGGKTLENIIQGIGERVRLHESINGVINKNGTK